MIYTPLLKEMLKKAEDIKNEYGSVYLCASHIAAAVADFCRTAYTGICLSDSTYLPWRFEEERLRYIFSKEVKLSAYFRIGLSHNRRNHIPEEAFDVASCEGIASQLGADMLSADVVFLCVLKTLGEPYRSAVRNAVSDDAVLAILQDIDANIYDYVIDKIAEISRFLQQKAEDAAAIRDWKPAAKFTEPDNLAAMFFEKIETRISEKEILLRLPRFFGASDLKVSIYKVGDVYYMHDHGCAIKHLSRRIGDAKKCEHVLKKVCHPSRIRNGRITGDFIDAFRFFYYLQMLVFVAHADLYYTRVEKPVCDGELDDCFPVLDEAEPIDNGVLDVLKKGVHFDYDEEAGLYYWFDTKYSISSCRALFLMETLEKGYVRISDKRKGKIEGEIFESFYWDNDAIAPYEKFITKITDRFGAQFDGKNVYLTQKSDHFVGGIFKFFNLAVLLSEFGNKIALPKLRQKV